jgi:cytochrome oxidase assembly protein ShyY1
VPPDAPAVPATQAFAPRYWPAHLLMVVAVLACVVLGRWQLGVWHSHRTDDAAAVTHERAVPLDDLLGRDAAFPAAGVGRPVVVTGRWDPARTVYVANRNRGGKPGFWAVTPVITGTGSGIPVVRGWTSSTTLAPAPPTGPTSLVGILQPADDNGATDSDTHDDVIPELSTTDLLARAPYDLYGGYAVATGRPVQGAAPNAGMQGLEPVTAGQLPGAGSTSGLRNLLYALQWWVFGAFALFVWWRWIQEDVLRRRRSPRPR